MSREFTCSHCKRPLVRGSGMLFCPTCGERWPGSTDDEDPRTARSRPGTRARRDDDDDDYYEDDDEYERPSKRRRSGAPPGKVQAIAIMTLIGGILASIGALGVLAYIGLMGLATLGFGLLCCLWPGPYYGLTVGILAILKGAKLLGKDAQSLPPPKGTAIMLIINIVNFDIVNCVLGILILVFCSDPEVENWYRG